MLNKLPKPFFVLAPMDDVTDTVFRQIVGQTAAPSLYFTEFVNVDGLQSAGREKLLPKLRFSDTEQPIIGQIWGKNPENYKQTAAELVDMGFAGVDINMGCPDKSIVKNGCCAALINDRELAKQIIDAAKEGIAGKVPLSVKTRIGYNTIDLSWIEFLLHQNLDMLAVHARTKKEMSSVPAHWELFGEITTMRNRISPKTLIVGNGDIISRQQGQLLAKQYSLDGVMIGRGIFHDPYVFAENSPWGELSVEDKVDLYKRHVELFVETWKNNERRIITLNKFCKTYINGFEGAGELRAKLMEAKTSEELLALLKTAVPTVA
jgi:tRNA-dihydrouridine synthase